MNSKPLLTPRRLWGTTVGLTALAAAASVLFGLDSRASAPPAAPPATPVSVATVAESEITAWDEFSGSLEAVEKVEVRSRVAGAVQAVHFREGALVSKGSTGVIAGAAIGAGIGLATDKPDRYDGRRYSSRRAYNAPVYRAQPTYRSSYGYDNGRYGYDQGYYGQQTRYYGYR